MKDDVISRQAALQAIDTWDKFGCGPDGKLVRCDDNNHYVPYIHYDDMVHAIEHLPSAEPEKVCIARINLSEEQVREAVERAKNEIVQVLSSTEPERPPEIQDILNYLDTVLHPIISPEHWDVYSELHDMISSLPSAQPKVSRIEQELHGKTPEEQYEFLYWLLLKFGLAYTDSRLAVIEWLRGEKEDG